MAHRNTPVSIPGEPIGLTSTIPVEILFAAGLRPVDLNNVFIGSERPNDLIARAEAAGFSHNICAWIKGIYSTVIEKGIRRVVAVTGGDCSNTIALSELLARKGVEIFAFDYPLNRQRASLLDRMDRLCRALSTDWIAVQKTKEKLNPIRYKLRELDRLTYRENLVTGSENHLFLVGSSDFEGDPDEYERRLDDFLLTVKTREPLKEDVRLGYLGVPPIFSGFYEYIESLGARVVFNEVQRQFSMPFDCDDVVDLYLKYTYPYRVDGRIADILEAVSERRLDGLIHYTQTFCYRQIYDIMLRQSISLPMLTLEGDRPAQVDSRTAFRLETFIEMLRDRKAEQ